MISQPGSKICRGCWCPVLLMLLLLLIPAVGHAQGFSVDLGEGGSATARFIQLIALITIISLAPSILIMVTSFVRIVVVLSIVRTAIGTPQSPSNLVVNALALFLTFFIMQPAFTQAWENGVSPYIQEEITEQEAFDRSTEPLKVFMLQQVRDQDLQLFHEMGNVPFTNDVETVSLRVLIPAFLISELRRAFEIGFLLFVPFIIIDIVVSTVIMSLGMMFLPPITISLPFKLIFFVLIDGWYMLVGSLVQSFQPY